MILVITIITDRNGLHSVLLLIQLFFFLTNNWKSLNLPSCQANVRISINKNLHIHQLKRVKHSRTQVWYSKNQNQSHILTKGKWALWLTSRKSLYAKAMIPSKMMTFAPYKLVCKKRRNETTLCKRLIFPWYATLREVSLLFPFTL